MQSIGYVRVSTEEQVRTGVSLDAQVQKIRAYAQLNQLHLLNIIRDEGLSAKNTARPGLKNLINLVSLGNVEAVIVCKLDRLSRRTIDTLNLIETFKSAGVAFHSIQEKVDTNTAMGQFFLTITAAFAQMERDLIAERTATALRYKRLNGEKTGGWTPYGYQRHLKNNTAILVEDKNEQRAIDLMRRQKTGGKSYRAIARELNQRKIPTRSAQVDTDRPTLWTHKTVAKILRNDPKWERSVERSHPEQSK